MKTYIDDLEVGQFIIFTDQRESTQEEQRDWGFFGASHGRRPTYNINGYPGQIVAIELPFIMVKGHQGNTVPVDVREVKLARVGQDYVKAFLEDVVDKQTLAPSFLEYAGMKQPKQPKVREAGKAMTFNNLIEMIEGRPGPDDCEEEED